MSLVVSETEYDAIGRPIKTKAAVGTASEIWSTVEYDDVAKRVISRSDIATKGDGKKIAVHHFDQLGRVRLTRSIENSATEDPYNEQHGIKVQTRYKTGNPHSYSLSSNPYRAATATQATNEESMDWTRSKSINTGKHAETETFAGANLPAPWGTNTSSTGKVQTDIDGNSTTVTDQSLKQRRSVTNALGQLIRIDEPDNSGNLGTAGSPIQPTNYSYNTLGNLVKVSQGNQNRFFKYDSLGRLIRLKQPEQTPNSSLAMSDTITGNNDWTIGSTYDVI